MRNLDALGLVSAYHHFHGEEQGAESSPTLHMLKDRGRPYHIDYCFVPKSWTAHMSLEPLLHRLFGCAALIRGVESVEKVPK